MLTVSQDPLTTTCFKWFLPFMLPKGRAYSGHFVPMSVRPTTPCPGHNSKTTRDFNKKL